MTTKEKTYTISVSERELARALFIMRLVNGEESGVPITAYAYDRLGAGIKGISADALCSKVDTLAELIGVSTNIGYACIQEEWEAFLGIGEEVKNKDILDKIANMERELAELKEML